jgi:DUF1680 family protein
VVRFVPSLPGYVYAVADEAKPQAAICVNLYVAGTGKIKLGDNTVTLTQETKYPWDGEVKLAVEPQKSGEFGIQLRIPDWCQGAKVAVNGAPVSQFDVRKGYARLQRQWQSGDVIQLTLPMPIQRIEAHPRVQADLGRVAVQRGPLVYCFEAVDNGGSVKNLNLPQDPKIAAEHRGDLLGGVTVITGEAKDGRKITAVPYYAWANRDQGAMTVWIQQPDHR